ncbi:MAG: hypothetical protein AMJ75_00325 [Phycisphaerae bacterium SM1_79]|nr:MAG: hypothetical protein AMJ75_00325 [Phycisphaerae bacterium SM1_79]
MDDYQCNGNCPANVLVAHCCRKCAESHKDVLNDENRNLWHDKRGFWSVDGCKLERDKMPQECKQYDCRHYAFIVIRVWANGKWRDLECWTLPKGTDGI